MSILATGTAAALGRILAPAPEIDEPLRPAGSLSEFARQIGYPLADHQADALELRKRITAIVAPRQAGKSRAVSVVALEGAVSDPGSACLIVSAGDAAAKRVLAMITQMAMAADPRGVQLAREPTHELIEFTNGSTIRCVPPSARRIRGWSIDLLIIDEAALVEDSVILSDALPTTAARPGARIVLASSPIIAAGAFYNFVTEGDDGSAHIAAARWTLEQSPWITEDTIAAAKASLPPARFAAEYLGEFPESGAGLLIPRAWIKAAQKRELPGRKPGAFGVDVARSGQDFTTIYRNRGGVVRELRRVNGQTTMETAGQVAALMRATPAVPAVVDVIGVGAGVVDRLAELGLRVVPFNAGARARHPERFGNRRAEVYWTLREHFEQGLVDLDPDDRDLADELALLRYDQDSRGRTLMEGKDSIRARGLPSPDRADALVQAVCAAPLDLLGEPGELGARPQPRRRVPSKPSSVRVEPGEGARLRRREM